MLHTKEATSKTFLVVNHYRYPFLSGEIFGCEQNSILEKFFESPESVVENKVDTEENNSDAEESKPVTTDEAAEVDQEFSEPTTFDEIEEEEEAKEDKSEITNLIDSLAEEVELSEPTVAT
jgi:hypothetical protein